ncbi:MAG: hypothetical protein CSA66_02845 [Proteobacteria bacterium]|nr:MAG: hypothetical protein CSA66_02845 [Pseudomonadota bacterium]
MIRFLGLALLALSLTFTACGSSDSGKTTATTTTTVTRLPDAQALVGVWKDARDTVALNGDGSYVWTMTKPCGAPPCPSTAQKGTYQLRGGKLYMSPAGGTDEVVTFQFSDDQKTLMLNSNKRGQSWSLMRGM